MSDADCNLEIITELFLLDLDSYFGSAELKRMASRISQLFNMWPNNQNNNIRPNNRIGNTTYCLGVSEAVIHHVLHDTQPGAVKTKKIGIYKNL